MGSQHQTSTAAALELVYTLSGYRLPRVKVVAEMKLLVTFLLVGSAMAQEFQKEADPPLNCQRAEKAKKGDRILMDYTGLLGDGNQFDRGSADFGLGEGYGWTVCRGEDHHDCSSRVRLWRQAIRQG